MFGHIYWTHRDVRKRCCSFFSPSHNCLFSLSFHPHIPSFFPSHFPFSVPSIPRASFSHSRLTGFFGTPKAHKHKLVCQCRLRPLYCKKGSLSLCLIVKQRKRLRTTNRQKTEGKEVAKEKRDMEGCAFLWLVSTGDMLLAVWFIIPKPYGLASLRGVVG